MKTIFISILSGVEAKAILRTDILSRILKAGDIRVVLFVKSEKTADFYRKDFSDKNILFEVIERAVLSWRERFFERLKHYLVRTETTLLLGRISNKDRRNIFLYAISRFLSLLLAHRAVRRVVRWLDEQIPDEKIFDAYFDGYCPDVVFLANLFDWIEIQMLREAQKRLVRTVGLVNSFDKITAKGFMRLMPNILLVPNPAVCADAVKYADVSTDAIKVVGFPEYDVYANKDGLLSHADFFAKLNIDASKRLVLFSPFGQAFSRSDWDMIDIIFEITHAMDAVLLVRFPPNDTVDQNELKKHPGPHYDIPGIRFTTKRGMDWDMTKEEFIYLKNTLHHASLVVSYASSIAVDAAILDKPIIAVGFEVRSDQTLFQTPTLRYGTTHYKRVLVTGAIKLARSKTELAEWIRKYLEDPSIDREGRQRLVREHCWKMDGMAGERIAEIILSHIK